MASEISLLSAYSLNDLLISIWAHGSSFYTSGYNQIVLYFLAHIVLALATGSFFS